MTDELFSYTNRKLLKTGEKHNAGVVSFDLPAGLTCPCAGACKKGCYAQGFTFKMHVDKYMRNYELSKSNDFISRVQKELDVLKRTYREVYVRLHSSGDFYDDTYFLKWMIIAWNNRDVHFYAYSKSVSMIKNYDVLPDNLKICFSYGGTEDHLIDPMKDCHARVFENENVLRHSCYVCANDDDLTMYDTKNVGLIYHGVKKYENTEWMEV